MPDPTGVYACEPQPIAIEGLRRVIAESEQLTFCGAAATLAEALEGIRDSRPNVILVDQSYGLKLTSQFIADVGTFSPRSHVVLWVLECNGSDCFRALQIGARGVLRKTLPVATLVDCLRSVGGGNVWIEDSISDQMAAYLNRNGSTRLTPRERDIVRCICRGLRNREIAAELGITSGTVKVHLMHIFEKTGVKDRFELALQGRRLISGEGGSAGGLDVYPGAGALTPHTG